MKKTLLTLALLVIFLALSIHAFPRSIDSIGNKWDIKDDSICRNIIGIYPIQLINNEVSLYFERRIGKKIGFGITAGFIYNSTSFIAPSRFVCELRPLSHLPYGIDINIAGRLPYLSHGELLKLYIKYYYSRRFNVSIVFLYKNLSFNNCSIFIKAGGGSPDYNVYQTRSEKSEVLGAEFLVNYQLVPSSKHLFFELYLGPGIRNKFGTRTILNEYISQYGPSPSFIPYNTTFRENYIAINFGAKINYRF